MYKIFKIIVFTLTIPPILVLAAVFVVALLPASSKPLDAVFKQACGVDLPNGYVVEEREPSRGFANQGVTYSEKGAILVSLKDAKLILENLNQNYDYKLRDGEYEKFVVGKTLGICQVSTLSGYINYTYAVW